METNSLFAELHSLGRAAREALTVAKGIAAERDKLRVVINGTIQRLQSIVDGNSPTTDLPEILEILHQA